jgi:hypothetical protein
MTKPHKFFERFLDNNLQVLTKELQEKYLEIEQAQMSGVTPVNKLELWQSTKSVSTMKWREYNLFQFHSAEIYNLYKSIRDMTNEACEYYGLDFEKEQYMIEGWFNINYANTGKIDWHDHVIHENKSFHGYYCVNAEPSVTHYKVFDNYIDNINKNNRAILSETGHMHAQGNWDWEGPRITIAYNVIPLKDIIKFRKKQQQHWIPLT